MRALGLSVSASHPHPPGAGSLGCGHFPKLNYVSRWAPATSGDPKYGVDETAVHGKAAGTVREHSLRLRQHCGRGAGFLDATPVHHSHMVGDVLHDTDVVGDEQVQRTRLTLQLLQQIQVLRLHRDIERRCRLVSYEQLRLHRQRARWRCLGAGPPSTRAEQA